MIRPLTLISASLFVLSGAYLFAVKQRSQVLEHKMAQVAQATRLDEQRVRVLQAQWALEVDPSRLQQLAANFTTLQPMKPSQMVALPQLVALLPAPNSPVPGDSQPAPALPSSNADGGAVAQAQLAPAVPKTGAQMDLASAEQVAPAANAVRADSDVPAHPAAPFGGVTPLGAQVNFVTADLVQPSADVVRPAHHVRVHEAVRRIPSTEAAPHKRLIHTALRREAPVRHRSESHLYMARATYAMPVAMPVPQAPIGARVMRVRAMAVSTPPEPPPMTETGGSMLGMAQSPEGGN
jgi:hypothetical protein